MLRDFIVANTNLIITRTRAKVAARSNPPPTETALKNGVPLFLEQLVVRLSSGTTADNGSIGVSAKLHGGEMLAMGFTISQVVHGYGDVCQVITLLAMEAKVEITPDEFHLFNRCLDDAIANAVSEFQRIHDESIARQGLQQQGMLIHEMRNRLSSAVLSYNVLKQGTVGIQGSTGNVLGRNLQALRDLLNKSLIDVRVEADIEEHSRVSVADVVREANEEGSLEAAVRDARLTVAPVAPDVAIEGDHLILAATLSNLLLNAFKFNPPAGRVSLTTTATESRVRIEVEDECGGLGTAHPEELFLPFVQRNLNRSGLGLGLALSRRGIEAMGGTLGVRDLPGKGCVFVIDLPRLVTP
jgi:signal transduction histidine kinase